MTKFVLKDMFEYIKRFLKRAYSSDQIKSSTFFSLQFYFQVVEVLHYVSQKSNSFPLSFPKKAENTLALLQVLLTSHENTKFPSQRTKISAKLHLSQPSFMIVH